LDNKLFLKGEKGIRFLDAFFFIHPNLLAAFCYFYCLFLTESKSAPK